MMPKQVQDLGFVAQASASQAVAGDWFTADELADLQLPGLPKDKRSINRRSDQDGWKVRTDHKLGCLARRRVGRGGGWEYHVSLLPSAARLALVRMGLSGMPKAEPESDAPAGGWAWFELQSDKVCGEARRRLDVVQEIDLLVESGLTQSAAVASSADRHGIGSSTLWTWLRLVKGVPLSDRLPALAPRRQGGGHEAEVDSEIWQAFKSDYLRLSQPTLAMCYARAAALAVSRGLPIPSERTMRRKLEREVDPGIILLRRGGEEALRRSMPAQRRTVAHLHAMEHVNIDGHTFDVFVELEDGRRIRPVLIGIQDVYSRKLLAWRVGETESAVLTRLAFADLFEKFGIPKACTLDNGRAFASKWITGGSQTRYRFKIKAEEPTGLLTDLGVRVHWTLPYRGQSKPVERAWRDLCDSISRGPAMEGAWTGNTVANKPENHGARAVPMSEFLVLVEQGIAAHNAKLGRRTETARGRSFDQVFAESYAACATGIGKATPEQLRRALLTAEQVRVSRQTCVIELYGNRYFAEACIPLRGDRVTVRFDPDNLHREIHVYDQTGRYVASAELLEDTGFTDVAGARAAAKQLADHRRKVRDGARAEQLLSAAEVAAMQPRIADVPVPLPAVVRPIWPRSQGAAALKLQAEPMAHKAHESNVFDALDWFQRDE